MPRKEKPEETGPAVASGARSDEDPKHPRLRPATEADDMPREGESGLIFLAPPPDER